MSDYEYHEFCRLHEPMTPAMQAAMHKLSSRANVGTHTAFFIYNYASFRGDPEKLLLKYFDVYYFLANYGCARLLLKYPSDEVDLKGLKSQSEKYIVECSKRGKNVLVDINISPEEAGGWTDGEGWLGAILPIYDEIKKGDYRIFQIAKAVHQDYDGDPVKLPPKSRMSKAQKSLLESVSYCV